MNFSISVNFEDTYSVDLVLVDPDPDNLVNVYSALFSDGNATQLHIFFEAPSESEVWEILHLCFTAFKEFRLTEGIE